MAVAEAEAEAEAEASWMQTAVKHTEKHIRKMLSRRRNRGSQSGIVGVGFINGSERVCLLGFPLYDSLPALRQQLVLSGNN